MTDLHGDTEGVAAVQEVDGYWNSGKGADEIDRRPVAAVLEADGYWNSGPEISLAQPAESLQPSKKRMAIGTPKLAFGSAVAGVQEVDGYCNRRSRDRAACVAAVLETDGYWNKLR